MCGRFSFASSLDQLLDVFDVPTPDWDIEPRYNIGPGQFILTVVQDGANRRLERAKWGLIPSWAKYSKIGYTTFNARSETMFVKPAFRVAARQQRCLIPADGFYEWKHTDAWRKQPYRIVLRDRPVFAFAGLYDVWTDEDGNAVRTTTIVTTRPSELMAEIHNRMPVILEKEAETVWLDPDVQNRAAVETLLAPYPANEMRAYPVSIAVNAVRNDGPACIEEFLS